MTHSLPFYRSAGPAAYRHLRRRGTSRGRALALAASLHLLGPLLWITADERREVEAMVREELAQAAA